MDSSPKNEDMYNAKRRPLRKIAMVSAKTGLILNIITTVQNARLHWHSPLVLSAWAFVPLILSIIWTSVDFYLLRKEGKEGRKPLAPKLIFLVDTLGFLAFLTLLIANGLTVRNLPDRRNVWRHKSHFILVSYNSFPWILSALSHLLVVMKTLKMSIKNSGWSCHRRRTVATCPHCQKKWKASGGPERTSGSEHRTLLQDEEYNDEIDGDAEVIDKPSIHLEDDDGA